MQLEREFRFTARPSAWEVAEYAAVMTAELAAMARQASLEPLARSLDETQRMARLALAELQANAAPDDAA